MPRRTAFSFELLDIHLQPAMRHAFAVVEEPPISFELSLRQRIEALRGAFDDKPARVQAAAAA